MTSCRSKKPNSQNRDFHIFGPIPGKPHSAGQEVDGILALPVSAT